MDRLLDEYEMTGTSKNVFYQELQYLTEHTKVIPFHLYDFAVMSYSHAVQNEKTEEENEKDDKFYFYYLQGAFRGEKLPIKCISQSKIRKTISEELLREMLNGPWFYDEMGDYQGKKSYMVSKYVFTTLLQKCELGGSGMLDNTLARNLLLAEKMGETKEPVQMLVRLTDSGRPKIFAIFSARYQYIPQTIIQDIITAIETVEPKMIMHTWNITNRYVECFVEFPNRSITVNGDKLIPGIKICNSDTGYVSCTISGTWRSKDSVIVQESNANRLRHVGERRDIQENIQSIITMIFEQQKEFHAVLKALQLHKVRGASKSTEDAQKSFLDLLNKVIRETELDKVLGAKRVRQLNSSIAAKMDWNHDYSAYDVCSVLINLPGQIFCDSLSTRNKIANGCGQAPYIL